jgi:predicted metal-binding membrane protein
MSTLELLLRQDRRLVVGALTAVVVLAWIYMLAGAGMSMAPVVWTPAYALLVFLMWWIMMVAMMLPSASPVILLFATVSRKQQASATPLAPASYFLAGYLLIWGLFSIGATAAQWGLQATGQFSMMTGSSSNLLSAGILIAAGLWQFTSLKQVCLRHCRSPLHFITHGFRPGIRGALRMGAEHGMFCFGCCWFLMGLLFYGGVMNIYWIAGLAIYVLIEKVAPAGLWIGRITGVVLLVWGGWLLALSVR